VCLEAARCAGGARKLLDAQHGVLAGVNFALHSAGWLEGGLVSSYEKFIIDVDQLVHDAAVRRRR
jgi:trimethylamine:corrinoid methyltransferase-like protein